MIGKDFAPILRERVRRDKSRLWRARRWFGFSDYSSWGYVIGELIGGILFLSCLFVFPALFMALGA
jgi:hypothetical protein